MIFGQSSVRFGTLLTITCVLSACSLLDPHVFSHVTTVYNKEGLIPGKTFFIVTPESDKNKPEFKEFADEVAQELQRHGYIPTTDINTAYYKVGLTGGFDGSQTYTTTYNRGSTYLYGSQPSGINQYYYNNTNNLI